MTTATPRFRGTLAAHDLRAQVPAGIRAIVQNGLVERQFRSALVPDFLYPRLASIEPISGSIGDTVTKTRRGLLTPVTTGLGGNTDPSAATYGIEQFSLTVDQFANSVDTNLLQAAISAPQKYLEDVAALGQNAGQSLNRISRQRLFAAYGGGVTFVPSGGSSSATLVVDDASGFDKVLVDGVPTAVSVGNPLSITINGVANTVVGCVLATNTLTLGTATATTTGHVVAASTASTIIRAGARTSQYTMDTTDVATLASFRSAVAALRQRSVPPAASGNYVAHIDAVVEAQLFADADFKSAYTGRGDSAVYGSMSLGTFVGIDWVRNVESPAVTKTVSAGTRTIRRSLVLGGGGLIAGPLSGMGDLLDQVNPQPNASNVSMVDSGSGLEVALIVREPQDRLQQVVSTTWSWVGDFTVPTDATNTSDAALYKRGAVVESI